VPAGVDEAKVRKRLLDGPGIEIAGGFGPLAGKVFRIGVMGPLATGRERAIFPEGVQKDPERGRLFDLILEIFLSVWRTAQDNRSIRPIIQGPRSRRERMTLKSVDTLLDVLQFADSHTAIVVPELGINVTYESLRQQVFAMANALASAGIRRGDAVAIALPNGLPAIVSFLRCFYRWDCSPLEPRLSL